MFPGKMMLIVPGSRQMLTWLPKSLITLVVILLIIQTFILHLQKCWHMKVTINGE